jgi:integrase
MEYAEKKDILYVMKLLGHRSIQSTLVYTHLISFESNEYHVKTPNSLKEAYDLAEADFDYFTTIDDVQVFRKRK